MLITGALIGGHQDGRDLKARTEMEKEGRKEPDGDVVSEGMEQRKES